MDYKDMGVEGCTCGGENSRRCSVSISSSNHVWFPCELTSLKHLCSLKVMVCLCIFFWRTEKKTHIRTCKWQKT